MSFDLNGANIKVRDAHLLQPSISIYPEETHTPAQSLVAEMMIMAGEAAGAYGEASAAPAAWHLHS